MFLLFILPLFFFISSPTLADDAMTGTTVRNLRARYDPGTDTITVDWEWRESDARQLEDYELFVRYKVSTQGGDEWRRVGADEDGLGARIPLGRVLNNGDELTVQVQAEPREPEEGSRQTEHSDPLVIWIARKTTEEPPAAAEQSEANEDGEHNENDDDDIGEGQQRNGGERERQPQSQAAGRRRQQQYELPEEELIPPFNFTANVLGPEQVQLQWQAPPTPSDARGQRPFYIVNVRQLSSNSGDRFPPQQIRVDDSQFQLGNLVPGESYEFTLRTALSADRISSAAAIVEIALPKEDELMEVGNLIVSSRFRPDGHGVVNLTWEVPTHLQGKIRAYEMRYADLEKARRSGPELWERLIFPGEAPTAQIYNMKADTEYLLRIRTTLRSGVQVESGEFRIRTPSLGGVNPLARLDVLYSSEVPTVRLQWILAPHVPSHSIAGFDVYISDRYDLPEREWMHRRVDGRAPQLALDHLQAASTYFVRVDVRNTDGTVTRSNAVYRFTTLDTLPLASPAATPPSNNRGFQRGESLAFQQIGRGRVNISWAFPPAVRMAAKGITIYYSSNPSEPMERWHQVALESMDTRAVVLMGLRPGLLYNVQIVPTGLDGRPMWEHAQRMQLKTEQDDQQGEKQLGQEEEEEGEGEEESRRSRLRHRGRRIR